jgi:hypothetical protein
LGGGLGIAGFIILRAGNGISVKRAYIGVCPEMTDCRAAKSASLAQVVRHFDRVLITQGH